MEIENKEYFINRLKDRPLIEMFFNTVGRLKKNKKGYYAEVLKKIKRWAEFEETTHKIPQLLCRICEKVVYLDKYLVYKINSFIAAYRIMSKTIKKQKEVSKY